GSAPRKVSPSVNAAAMTTACRAAAAYPDGRRHRLSSITSPARATKSLMTGSTPPTHSQHPGSLENARGPLPRDSRGPPPTPPEQGFRDGAIQPARRTRGEIHAQSEAKDRGKQCARERHADDSPSACPTARPVTPTARRHPARATKYSHKGVLHDFARGGNDFRRG